MQRILIIVDGFSYINRVIELRIKPNHIFKDKGGTNLWWY